MSVIDLPRVRAALAALDQIEGEHPEAFAGHPWTRILEREDMNHEATTQIAVRMPASMLSAVDAWLAKHREEHPGIALTRSDAIRALVARSLPRKVPSERRR